MIKDKLKVAGRLIVTLILMGFAIVFMFKFPNYSWSAVFIVALLVIWDFMYYKDFKYFKINRKGIEAGSRKNNNQSKTDIAKVDYHNEFAKMIRPSSAALRINPVFYESPVRLPIFLKLTSEAKKHGFDFKNDSIYIKLHRQIQSDVAFNLIRAIKAVYNTDELSPYARTLIDWCRVTPVSQKGIMEICKNIYSKDGKKDELTIQFDKAINDLKKLEL